MSYDNQADEYRKLQERYAELSDEQIAKMWDDVEDFTAFAQQALRAEVAKRGLDKSNAAVDDRLAGARQDLCAGAAVRGLAPPPSRAGNPTPFPAGGSLDEPDLSSRDPAAEGLDPTAFDLVPAWTVDSLDAAGQVLDILDTVGVKEYLGPDNVEIVDDYKGSYDAGVEIKVMKFQQRFVTNGLRRYLAPRPDRDAPPEDDFEVKCPRCNSPDVVLDGFNNASGKASDLTNNWTCAACDYHWEDDGVITDAG